MGIPKKSGPTLLIPVGLVQQARLYTLKTHRPFLTMQLSRRDFVHLMAAAYVTGCTGSVGAKAPSISAENLYDPTPFGNVSLLHFTDCHAQLNPLYFREPNFNLGLGNMHGQPPHLVGKNFLKHYGLPQHGALAHAFTYLDFDEASATYGKVGGFAHLKTLVDQMRGSRPGALLLDGGDTWQGSATALWTNAQDMVDAQIALGVDIMTGHWEFTYGAERVTELIEGDLKKAGIDFLAQNVKDTEFEDPVFKAYSIRDVNGHKVAIIGQAFPYTPIANPRYMVPDWAFGIRPDNLQEQIDEARGEGAEVVVLLSHNGMDVDLKLASKVRGLDAIMGGHTHDAVPEAIPVKNAAGTTWVTNAGSNGKFLAVLDFTSSMER